jgi:hypothetical protein
MGLIGHSGKKFDVKYIPQAELDEMCKQGADKPLMETFYHEALKMIADSKMEDMQYLQDALKKEGKEGLFKPVGVRAYLEKWWKGVA